ncbi:MAG: transcriptional regulator, partial [Candidatus Tectomicrobia bacterium]|nr:transcriptional regulator [Candidatus Tectomicrobia bacterium]
RNSEHFRKAYLVPALASGLLEMTIPAKPKSRLQQYRLTPQGRRWLVVQTGDQPVS